nr:hypothetical protein [Geobacter sp. SVR]
MRGKLGRDIGPLALQFRDPVFHVFLFNSVVGNGLDEIVELELDGIQSFGQFLMIDVTLRGEPLFQVPEQGRDPCRGEDLVGQGVEDELVELVHRHHFARAEIKLFSCPGRAPVVEIGVALAGCHCHGCAALPAAEEAGQEAG